MAERQPPYGKIPKRTPRRSTSSSSSASSSRRSSKSKGRAEDGGHQHRMQISSLTSISDPKGKSAATSSDEDAHALPLSRQPRARRPSYFRAKSAEVAAELAADTFGAGKHQESRPSTSRRSTFEGRAAARKPNTSSGETTPKPEVNKAGPSSETLEFDDGPLAFNRSRSKKRSEDARMTSSRSLAPASLRAFASTAQASAAPASQYLALLGQPSVAAASISAPEKSSAGASALPSLYKVSRGRSANVSPSRRWDRRCASASVLSGASASGSGSEEVVGSRRTMMNPERRSSISRRERTARRSKKRSSVSEDALFPSDEDDEDDAFTESSSSEREAEMDESSKKSRRWSSVERDRRRGMRILLAPGGAAESEEVVKSLVLSGIAPPRPRRRQSASSDGTLASEGLSDGSGSSCSECIAADVESLGASIGLDPNPASTKGDGNMSEQGTGSGGGGSSSIESQPSSKLMSNPGLDSNSDLSDPSLSSSVPSSTLVQRSPPSSLSTRPIVAVPVESDADPLLGFTMGSVEDIIAVDQVEFCTEDSSSDRDARSPAKGGRRKPSWILGETSSDEEQAQDELSRQKKAEPLQPPNSYQVRLAGLQSQLRIWSRNENTGAVQERQPPTVGNSAVSESLLSSSWRNLARLPNLILLPGLAARAEKSHVNQNLDKSEVSSLRRGGFENVNPHVGRGSRTPSPSGSTIEARQRAATRTGEPPSPSLSPSPPSSLVASRHSSSDSISATERGATPGSPLERRGRGVATPLEGDQDPSAYVSGLGQPIDPDTELSSVVHLQTFRSRSRGKAPTEAEARRAQSRSVDDDLTGALKPTVAEKACLPTPAQTSQSDVKPTLFIDTFSASGKFARQPTDIASAPASPTRADRGMGSSSSSGNSDDEEDGFTKVLSRRARRRSSGPRSTRPKVEAPVPKGFSAFAIEEGTDESNSNHSSGTLSTDSDGDNSRAVRRDRSGSRRRQARSRGRGVGSSRDTSPARSDRRQCAVGLFGGGMPSTGRRRGSGNSHHSSSASAIRTVRSSPDLTYAAAASRSQNADWSEENLGSAPSPPRTDALAGSSLGGASVDPAGQREAAGVSQQHLLSQQQMLRPRLLSNSSHLLMLSLELEMIKKRKISAPLKPRWGKQRANDFNPLPAKYCRMGIVVLASPSPPLVCSDPAACEEGSNGGEAGGAAERASRAGEDNGRERREEEEEEEEEDEDRPRGRARSASPQLEHAVSNFAGNKIEERVRSDSRSRNYEAHTLASLRDASSRLRYSWTLD
ncbi:hypothetical protein IE53DRAFT_359991 [Violaceomyces palustris]|uniref:Uncharacterized protein n=1 Tax=Violaceomyces palustris TaxID=1673888 RepID=A0ACD0P5W5_9BASI|nr:hypothetical protein IE53DRAFT_359991 [Violaceomyces palustris]